MTRMIMMTMAKINYGACARIGARQQWEQLNVVWVKMAIIWMTDVSLAWIKEAYIENMSLVDLLQNFKLHLPGVFKEVRTQRRTRQKICTDILVNCTDILVNHTDTVFLLSQENGPFRVRHAKCKSWCRIIDSCSPDTDPDVNKGLFLARVRVNAVCLLVLDTFTKMIILVIGPTARCIGIEGEEAQ